MSGIAIIGAGIFATEEHLPSLKRVDANLKAVYSRSKSSAENFLSAAQKLGFAASQIDLYSDDSEQGLDDLLKRPDIAGVIIVLPITIQPAIIRRCLAAGKHVLSEKPIAEDVRSARELISDYQQKYAPEGLILSIAEQFRYMKANEVGRRWIVEDNAIGTLIQVHVRMWRNFKPGGKYVETAWRKIPAYQGGFVLDGGVHHIALARYVSGQEIVETRSFATQLAAHLPPVDTVNAAILLSGGASGTLSMSFASTKPATEFVFIGTKGTLTINMDGPNTSVLKLQSEDGKLLKEQTVESQGIDCEIKAFLHAIAAGKAEERAGVIEALNDVAVVESLYAGGGRVDIWKS
ncbi:hypothetical protein VTN77DRAFT_9289 [Rasamsonia byssochlamydoides]|uniref:uncharacterized protein n=1 Tax=Rasamsonia byssochlamydoides TaxID=89139 RepID=UPI0037445CB0